jgi:gamma-glutamyltranspeptidase/glutathione hydrolase
VAPPPPSSGGVTLCETLAVLEPYPLGDWGFGAAQGVHTLVEALRHSYFDRNATLGDPDFVANPTQRLLSPAHIAEIRAAIKERATPSAALQQPIPHEGGDTTSYAVIDRYGDAVAVTYTINGFFGADVIGGDTGFFLNNEMDDFTSKPSVGNVYGLIQGSANRIEGGKRPLSSMTPTIVLKDGHVFMALGSPGGPRIITSVLETLLNVVDYGMSLTEAVDTPRLHHQWLPDTIYTEPYALSPDTAHALLAMGYTITPQREWSAVEAILAGPPHPPSRAGLHAFADDTTHDQGVRPGFLYGANDARRPSGAAVGY